MPRTTAHSTVQWNLQSPNWSRYPEREEEGALLRKATEKGVVNVARYFHHETVQVDGQVEEPGMLGSSRMAETDAFTSTHRSH
jgi:hypothetical protein